MTDTPEWSGWAEYPPTPVPPTGSGAAPAGSAGSEPDPDPPPPFSAPSGFDWTPSGAGYQAAGPPPGPAAPFSTAAPAGRPRHTVAVAAVVAIAMFFAGAAGGALIVNA